MAVIYGTDSDDLQVDQQTFHPVFLHTYQSPGAAHPRGLLTTTSIKIYYHETGRLCWILVPFGQSRLQCEFVKEFFFWTVFIGIS
jgi:hypothetical protein